MQVASIQTQRNSSITCPLPSPFNVATCGNYDNATPNQEIYTYLEIGSSASSARQPLDFALGSF
jgi:hypothetical protein